MKITKEYLVSLIKEELEEMLGEEEVSEEAELSEESELDEAEGLNPKQLAKVRQKLGSK